MTHIDQLKLGLNGLMDASYSFRDMQMLVRDAYIQESLRRSRGNKCRAARSIGVHRNTIQLHVDGLNKGTRYANDRKVA